MLSVRNKKTRVVAVIMILAVLLSGFRYIYLNNKYPPPSIQQYHMNQSMDFKNATLTVLSRSFMSDKEIEKYCSEDLSSGLTKKCIIVKIKLENKTQTDIKIDVSNLAIEAPAYTNCINLATYMRLNEGNPTLNPNVKAGKNVILQIPYDLLEYSFSRDTWETIDKMDFKLVISLYPIKKDIQL